MLKRFAVCLLLGIVACASPAFAQGKKKAPAAKAPPAKEKPAKEDPAKEPAPEPAKDPEKKTDDAPAEAKGPAAEKFAATYDKWKAILKQLRDVQTKYQSADAKEQDALKAQWDKLIGEADEMLPTLRKDAMAAYDEAPNLDSSLTRFLVKLLSDDVARDDYDAGKDLADLLIKNGCDFKQIYNAAGIIAFVTNDYENAEKHLKQAQESKSLNPLGEQFLSLIPEYKEFWEKEKAIREAEAKADDLPRVKIETSKGTIVIELFENEAPMAVGNFVNLVEKGFYDGTIFHRVLPNFMAQGGDPKGTGTGGPGYQIPCECYKDDRRNHFRGTLSMAHSGKDTGGSQFFLTFIPTAHLNGLHTAFGRVVEGMDVLAKLQRIDPSKPSAAATPDKIIKATVERKRDHEYVPTKVE
jgi:cyclophilin family peptidyl-prolyl cis-trans isomerase